ncbi:MAG: type II toxin-antitoxin system HicB family antitoxin [Thermodesulfovibrionales bacterium]|nr:type II toxin-antitoxin system HicB family antitoxin [Thermodesulfovibrionales bacterium]MDP3112129.1 type II toxin-antitoxin system HicB family antitoxin [Thermodesulfovibrionales bacterium]
MKDVLTYKGFIGSVHFSAEDRVFHGKIEGITDLVSFEGHTVNELIRAFHEAVDDYIALCKKVGKEPLKSCKGSFNVRVPSELHTKAIQKASMFGISLNQLVQKAMEKAVAYPVEIIGDFHKAKTKKRVKVA